MASNRLIDANGVVIHDNSEIAELSTPKDPDEILDYRVAWGDWLRSGESITGRQWISDGVFTIDSSAQLSSEIIGTKSYGSVEIVWLSGGILGQVGLITCRITTDQGRTADRSFRLRCDQR